MAPQPVELHVVSDSTGATATRPAPAAEAAVPDPSRSPGRAAPRRGHALGAQFPDQAFEEIRHPMVESVDDLELAVLRAKGRPAGVGHTLGEPALPADER